MAERDLTLVGPPPDLVADAAVLEREPVLEQASVDVQRLEAAYELAFERAMRAQKSGEIADAFDEADRLQGRLIRACRRFHQLRERSAQPPVPPDQAA